MDFQEADRHYADLKQRHKAGDLTHEEFDEQLKQLMVQDNKGRWWVKSRSTGEWHYHNGTVWIKDTPPGYLSPQAAQEDQQEIKQSQRDKSSLPPAPNRRGLYWGAGATGLVAILLPQIALLFGPSPALSFGTEDQWHIVDLFALMANVIIQYVATSILVYKYRIAWEWAAVFVASFYILNLIGWAIVSTFPSGGSPYDMTATFWVLFASFVPNALIVSFIAYRQHRQRPNLSGFYSS